MKLILLCLFLIVGVNTKDVSDKVYSKTGHTQFSELIMVDDDTFIINDVDEEYINQELKDLKVKFIGTNEKIFNKDKDATYVSNVIFSRSNKTREAYTFVYDTSTIEYSQVSVSVKGNITTKGVFKLKSKELTISGDLTGTKDTEEYTKTQENGKLSVVVYPNKMITLRIVGNAKITNGVMKKSIFGIVTKKGAFEVVTVTSTCYELIETDA